MAGVRRKAFNYVNRLRNEHGLSDLVWNRDLNRPTRRHSNQMARAGTIFHTEGDVLNNKMNRFVGSSDWTLAGENVGKSGTTGLHDLLEAFRKSDQHRHNMLRPKYTDMSVGVARDDNGAIYLTYWFND